MHIKNVNVYIHTHIAVCVFLSYLWAVCRYGHLISPIRSIIVLHFDNAKQYVHTDAPPPNPFLSILLLCFPKRPCRVLHTPKKTLTLCTAAALINASRIESQMRHQSILKEMKKDLETSGDCGGEGKEEVHHGACLPSMPHSARATTNHTTQTEPTHRPCHTTHLDHTLVLMPCGAEISRRRHKNHAFAWRLGCDEEAAMCPLGGPPLANPPRLLFISLD
jgi:hypothetical protein